jgi:hypothetical protein
MKKILLSIIALAGTTGLAFADTYVPGTVKQIREGYSLSNVGGNAQLFTSHPSMVRTAIGVNGAFYCVDFANGVVKVYGPQTETDATGKITDLILRPSDTDKPIWVSCTADDNGHVIVRTDRLNGGTGWAGVTKDGKYASENASFSVIDSKAVVAGDNAAGIVKTNISMQGANSCRFDMLGHVSGNILEGSTSLFAPCANVANSVGELAQFNYTDGEWKSTEISPITIDEAFANFTARTNAKITTTMGQAMAYGDGVAVFANPEYKVTGSEKVGDFCGLGNAVELYNKAEGSDKWAASGKFFITPKHANFGGFFVFSLQGKDYIVYPSGYTACATANMSADGFAIAEVGFATSPESNATVDDQQLVALVDPAMKEDGSYMFPKAQSYAACYNVEPVPDDPCSVYIYTFSEPFLCSQWKFTVPEQQISNAVIGGVKIAQEGYALQNVWSHDANLKVAQTSARSGVGANDHFYTVEHGAGLIHVYGKDGLIKDIAAPEGCNLWVTASADDADHAIIRVDKHHAFNGYTTNGQPGFFVIDTKTSEIINDYIPLTCDFGMRCDALGHVAGNILEGEDEHIFVTVAANGKQQGVVDFTYKNGEFVSSVNSLFTLNSNVFTVAGMQNMTSTASALSYENGKALAVFANPYSGGSGSSDGFGNAIQRFEPTESAETPWAPTGKYIITPQHSFMPGFNIFNINGVDYVIYPSGQNGGAAAADAFAIAKVAYAESPASADTDDSQLVARTYAATDENYALLYKANTACTPVYNVVPCEDDENSVYIYMFSSGAPLAKWKFTAPAVETPEPETPEEPEPEPEVSNAVIGGVNIAQEGYALQNVWAHDSNLKVAQTSTRSGVGANDHFYTVEHEAGLVHVYGQNGYIKDIAAPEGCNLWVTASADDADHAIVRVDKAKKFNGYTTDGQPGFFVIDTKTSEIINDYIPLTCDFGMRCDALGHVAGNILEGEDEHIFVTVAANGKQHGVVDFTYKNGEFVSSVNSLFTLSSEVFTVAGMQKMASTASALSYENGKALAVYANPYLGGSGSSDGFGNSIQRFEPSGNSETPWSPTGKYIITPQHSFMPGFNIFNINGVDYVIYPSGQSEATAAADAFAIAKVAYAESPVSADTDDSQLVVRTYAATDENYALLYKANTACTPVYNVVPCEDDANSVYIYMFNSGAPLAKWKFTAPEDSNVGVKDIQGVNENAPVEYFNLQGIRVANPQKGFFIKRQGNKVTKVIL